MYLYYVRCVLKHVQCVLHAAAAAGVDHVMMHCTDIGRTISFFVVSVQGGPKNGTFFYALTLLNINRFSKLFHCQNQEKICNNTVIMIPPHLKCVSTLPCEMSVY